MTNEVLESLRVCAAEGPCTNCHEKIGRKCISNLTRKAADAIENLLTENAAIRRKIDNMTSTQAVMVKEFDKKMEELAKVKKERDAAVRDLKGECFACEHVDTDCPAMNCRNGEKFKWRGLKKEEKYETTDD